MSGLLARPSNIKDSNIMCRIRRRRYITRSCDVNDASSAIVNSLTKHFSTSKGLDKKRVSPSSCAPVSLDQPYLSDKVKAINNLT